MHTITPGYAELNAQLHQSNPNYGTSSGRWVGVVRDLTGFLSSRDILDYGCGKQRLAAGLPDLPVRGYDPAIPGLDAPPAQADLVVCTDVLEHVEPELVDNVLGDLARVTRKLGFFTVATCPAKKVLADGRNAHLTQQPIEWWLAKLEARFTVLGYHNFGGQEFLVLVAANTGAALTHGPDDGWLSVAVHGANVSLRLPAALRADTPEATAEARLARAQALRRTGALDEAEVLLRELTVQHPDFPEALIELGQLLKEKRQGPRKTVISTDYAQLNAELHARNPQYGTSGQRWASVVSGLAGWLPTLDILDYGCGKQTLAASLPRLPVRGYDPALPGLNAKPEPADLVVCTDVLEHVEPELVDNVLDDLARVTRKLGFFTVATRPAVKVLADGRNAHLTQQPIEWWLAKFKQRFSVHQHRDYGGQEFYVLVSSPVAGVVSPPSIDALRADETPPHSNPAITLSGLDIPAGKAPQLALSPLVAETTSQPLVAAREHELRAALAREPEDAEALCKLGAILYQQGHLDEAEKLLRRAYRLHPDWAELLNNLGHLLLQRGNVGEASGYFRRATELQPGYPMAWNSLGVALMQQGHYEQAEQALRKAVELKPDYSMAWINLGLAQVARDVEGAESTLLKALLFDPSNPDVLLELAKLYVNRHELEKAAACLEVLIASGKADQSVYFRAGILYRQMENAQGALDVFLRAMQLDPSHPGTRRGLAAAFIDAHCPAEAAAVLRELLAEDDRDGEALNLIGIAYRDLGQLALAEAVLLKATMVEPDFIDPYVNLGQVHEGQGNFEAAMQYCDMAVSRRPDYYRAGMNRAILLDKLGRTAEALAAYRSLVLQHPMQQDAHHNLALIALRCGEWQTGWDEYQWRNWRYNADFGRKERWQPETPPLPENLSGKTVLVLGEQGIGDEFFFLRWLPALLARGPRVLYRPKTPKALDVIQALFPQIELVQNSDDQPYDYMIFAGDLPLLTGSAERGDTPPSLTLALEPAWQAPSAALLGARKGARPLIGVAWRAGLVREGNISNRDRTLEKALPLEFFAMSMKNVAADFVILQRGPSAEELDFLREEWGADRVIDASYMDNQLLETMGLLAHLDDVVGVSNTNLHLLAMLGKTASVLVPSPGEFRWLHHDWDASPWFPAYRLYRQGLDGDWVPPLIELNGHLLERFGEI
jgi:tetratricopeptide (TPR) repeat protein